MIQHVSSNAAAAKPQYECESCLHRVRAESRPSGCPDCESPMHNISVPRE